MAKKRKLFHPHHRSLQSQMTLVRSPSLQVIEVYDRAIEFQQLGEQRRYNTLEPAATLKVLKILESPKTLVQIKKEFRGKGTWVLNELERLQTHRLVWRLPLGRERVNSQSFSYLMSIFESHQISMAHFEQIFATKVHLIDLCRFNWKREFESGLKDVGFASISFQRSLSQSFEKLEGSIRNVPRDSFIVVLTDGALPERLVNLSRLFKSLGQEWLLVTLDSNGGIIGPVLGNFGGPCFDCIIKKRSRTHGYSQSEFGKFLASDMPLYSGPSRLVVDGIIPFFRVELLKYVSGFIFSNLQSGYFSIDVISTVLKYDQFGPQPDCPICFAVQSSQSEVV